MRTLLLTFALLLSISVSAQEYIVFNNLYKGTVSGSGYTLQSSSLNNITLVSGVGFRFTSRNSTFSNSLDGNNVLGTLTYSNNGVLVTLSGTISRSFSSGNEDRGFYFFVDANNAFMIVVPGFESNFSNGNSPGSNSSFRAADLIAVKNAQYQASNVRIDLTNDNDMMENDSDPYSYFTLTISANRTTGGGNTGEMLFTPTIVSGTATSSTDISTIYYTKTVGGTWLPIPAGGISIAYNENTIYLRVLVSNDSEPECTENFTIQTGVFTGDGAVQADNYYGIFAVGNIIDDNDPLIWDGSANDKNWDNQFNWGYDKSPNSCYCLVIRDVTNENNTPNITSSTTNTTFKKLTVESTGKILIDNNATLKVTGDLILNNSTDGVTGNGTLELNGTAIQNISGNGLVKNIKFNNPSGFTISSEDGNKLNVLGVLSVTAGSITTNDNLVFKATSTEEGIVGTISTCPTDPFNGNVIVERYIPATARSLRFITPGVYSSTVTIKQNWQEGVNELNKNNYGPNATNLNPKPGYGTHITGSTVGDFGLDATITGNPSMYAFENRTIGYGWQTITNTDTTRFRRPGQAFAIMIRGDRSVDLTSNTPPHTSTILRTKGRLTNCSYTFTSDVNSLVPLNPDANAYSFIGNPFWSIVNWSRVTTTNVDNKIYYFDAAISGSNSVGGYVTFSIDPNDPTNESKDSKQFSGTGVGRVSRYLQPGQGFFVKKNGSAGAPIITFEESDKENSSSNKLNVFSKNPSVNIAEAGDFDNIRVRTSNKYEKIYVSLYLKQNINKAPADGFLISYNSNYTDTYGYEDADKLSNQDENMFVNFAGRRLAILGLKSTTDVKSDTIPVSFTNLYDQDYIMHFDFTNNVDPQREIFLFNKATGSRQKINDSQVFDLAFRPQPGIRSNSDYVIVVNSKKIENKGRVRKPVTVITNPITNGVLQFSVPSENMENGAKENIQVNIFDLSGRLLLTKTLQKSMNIYESVNVDNLRAGSYLLKIMHGDEVHTKKIIKR